MDDSLASLDSNLSSSFNPQLGNIVEDVWKNHKSTVKPLKSGAKGYSHRPEYYDEDNYEYYYYYEDDEDYSKPKKDFDPWGQIYKDGRFSKTQYYDPMDDVLQKKSETKASFSRSRHPLGQLLNSIRPLTVLLFLSIPVLLGGLYYLFVVNGPTPVVRARINDLIEDLDNENDIPSVLYNFLSQYKKKWFPTDRNQE